ncbi:MAG: GNAT family N-acetyltransferase [Candidatus Gracilibacteria bacterium]|jgi:ribosomal-protein-alanine N-acetyltransferase|nr:GNAT family N-acetyltransferase [Candidatus Gracilibacteria bacterium]
MIKLRPQKISDAKRFFEILNNPNFTYFSVKPKSLEEEKNWLADNPKRIKENTERNFTIMFNGKIVGAIGVKINFHRKYIGEIGYFLDETYWGKGITTQAVKLIEYICFNKLSLKRLEILMQPENIASEKVAIKNNYLKEGLLKKVIQDKDGSMKDCFLYAKVL